MTKLFKKITGTMVLMVALICLACPAAFASSDVDIYVGTTFKDNLDVSELNALGTVEKNYSSYKCNGSFSTYTACGPLLSEALITALNDPNITSEADLLNAYSTISFTCTDDSYTSGVLNLYDVLHGYYYSSLTDTTGDPVPAIIATSVDPTPLRDFFGQQEASDKVAEGWVSDLDKIVLGN